MILSYGKGVCFMPKKLQIRDDSDAMSESEVKDALGDSNDYTDDRGTSEGQLI
jgi:hypothetical protein